MRFSSLIIAAATSLHTHLGSELVSAEEAPYDTHHGLRSQAQANPLKGRGGIDQYYGVLKTTREKSALDAVGTQRRLKIRRRRGKAKKRKPKAAKTEAPTPTITNAPKKKKSKKLEGEECSGDDYIPCSHDGYYLCLFDETSSEYATTCSEGASASGSGDSSISLKHTKDYCGQCSISRQFIHDSVVKEMDPIQGTEYVTSDNGDVFKTEFDATFNEFDLISLAASKDLVASVECTNLGDSQGQISIIFESDIDSSLASRMFQEGSLVVVDGSMFGSCDVAGDANKDFTTNPVFDGFLLIESVLTSGPTVTLIGEVGSLHYMFASLFMKSTLLQNEERKLAATGGVIKHPYEFKLPDPDSSPVYLDSKLELTARSSIDFSETSWSFFSKKFQVACDFEFEVSAELSSVVYFDIDSYKKNLPPIMFPSEDPSAWGLFKISLYKVPVAVALEVALKPFLPKSSQIKLDAGLSLGYPLVIRVEEAAKIKVEVARLEVKSSTGRKRLKVRYNGSGLPTIETDFEEPSFEPDIKGTPPDFLKAVTAELKLNGFVGIEPQVVFETFGLMTGSVGIQTGLFLEAKTNIAGGYKAIEDNPGLPYLVGTCGTCHYVELNIEAGLQAELIFWFKLLKSEKVKKKLPIDVQLKLPLLTVCAIDGCETTPSPTPAGTTTWPTTWPTSSVPAVDIDVDDLIVFGSGGEPNKMYVFTFLAHDIPETVENIRFEWSPGIGAPDFADASVTNGEASTSTQLSYPKPGSFMLEVDVYDDEENRLLASSWVYVSIAGAVLSVDPPNLDDAEVGVQYTFELSASGVKASEIKFGWSFGVGSGGTGSETVQVAGGEASISISHTYTSKGAFGLVADIRNIEDDKVVATRSLTVIVGEKIEREYDLEACVTWKAASQGGQGVTMDLWNISAIPPGAIFDMKFDCYRIPDRILVSYEESLVEDTGWRGSADYDGQNLFPGGVISPGDDTINDMFTRLSQDNFFVTVVGPGFGTRWKYSIRCRFDSASAGQSLVQVAEYSAGVEVEAGKYDSEEVEVGGNNEHDEDEDVQVQVQVQVEELVEYEVERDIILNLNEEEMMAVKSVSTSTSTEFRHRRRPHLMPN